uniref:BHLH domain-containing protein n=2 Tax=Chenopodium quinoa TaxID=63459 RepID=A0A803MEF8_CHEQI
MVCQAASQTRFRALKHENGVAGFATIIVRVIACFQPLRRILSSFAQASNVDKKLVLYFGGLVQLGFLGFTTSSIILQAITKRGFHFAFVVLFGLMEKDLESWLHQRQPDTQFPNAKSLKLPFDIGMQNTGIPCAMPCTNAAPVSGALPSFGYSGPHDFKVGQSKEPYGWFYCLPRFRQGLVPDMTLHDKFMPEIGFTGKASAAAIENHVETNVSPTDAQRAQKQFLVFDRTGNKTTLILSSMVGASNQPLNSWNQKSSCYYNNVNEGELGDGSNGPFYSGPNLTDDLNDDNEIGEMHEDSEDIDALLSSDDEGCYSDGEETSTGRSPSTMTAYEKQDWYEDNEDMDEVASSAGPSKRQKLSDSSDEAPSVTYAASSLVPKGSSSEYEDDAESICAGGQPTRPYSNTTHSFSGNKRDRKEKIRETVSILQTIIPGGDGKDAVVVLDEAINYLKTLRYKAKSLGISGL